MEGGAQRKEMCVHVSFTHLKNEVVQKKFKYPGVTLLADCTWNEYIDHVVTRACRSLEFLRRKFEKDQTAIYVNELAHVAYMRPVLSMPALFGTLSEETTSKM